MKKIVVDIFGGDNAPIEIMKGCLDALNKATGFGIVMSGDNEVIEQFLADKKYDKSRIEILDAKEVITNDEVPTVAIRAKKNSSLVMGLDRTKNDSDVVGFVSAGSTGAVLAGATLRIGRIRGVQRPALAPLLPTLSDRKVLLIDCGANVDCKPQMLLQFAQMGHAFMNSVMKVENPRIGLLSNGTEDKKGNELTHETFALLKESGLNFCGNMEARDILSGDYDVVVADGFYGNIALKSCEGTALMMLKLLKRELTATLPRKLAALMLKPAFKNVKEVMDYNKSGGAPFLGVSKVVIKSHGSSKSDAICGSILQAWNFAENNLIENITPYFSVEEQ